MTVWISAGRPGLIPVPVAVHADPRSAGGAATAELLVQEQRKVLGGHHPPACQISSADD